MPSAHPRKSGATSSFLSKMEPSRVCSEDEEYSRIVGATHNGPANRPLEDQV